MQLFLHSRSLRITGLHFVFLICLFGLFLTPTYAETEAVSNLNTAKALSSAFADVYDKVAPAVVIIDAERGGDSSTASREEALRRRFNFFFKSPQGQGMPVPQSLRPDKVEASGFVIRPDGYILTNNHVLEEVDPRSLQVKLKDGRKLAAQIVGRDDKTDLAVLKVDGEQLPFIELADSDKVRIGEFALAIGAPFNLPYSLTSGIVSAKGRTALTHGLTEYEDYIQTDASINPGNSGGPLCDLDGRVIGVNTVIYGINRGLGFAIPSNMAKMVSDQLIAKGYVSRAWLGVSIETLGESLKAAVGKAMNLGDLDQGVVIRDIVPGAPASRSNIQHSDIITKVDGIRVATAGELQREILAKKVGQNVALDIWRNGQFIRVSVQTGERPGDAAPALLPSLVPQNESNATSPPFGLMLQELTADLARKLGLPPTPGVVVTGVELNSAAATAEVQVGDIITRVGDQSVTQPEEVYNILKSADSMSGTVLLLQRGNQRTFAILK